MIGVYLKNKTMKTILKALCIIQIQRKYNSTRINPYNPLSYITIVLTILIGILMFGFVGVWKEIDLRNPFKYQ